MCSIHRCEAIFTSNEHVSCDICVSMKCTVLEGDLDQLQKLKEQLAQITEKLKQQTEENGKI